MRRPRPWRDRDSRDNPQPARRAHAIGFCPTSAGNTSSRWSFLSGFLDRCSYSKLILITGVFANAVAAARCRRAAAGKTLRQSGAATELYQSLIHHRIGDFEEAGDVGAVHVVAGGAVLLGGFVANLVDHAHDVVQTCVDF